MKSNKSFIFIAVLTLVTLPLNAASNIYRAKILVRGAKIYREQTLPQLYDFLRTAGFSALAKKLNDSVSSIKQVDNAIEENLKKNLSSSESRQRRRDKSLLERYQILMDAKVLNEINKLFNTLDNITSNLGKEVRDYRTEQKKLAPSIASARKIVEFLSKQAQQIKITIKKMKKTVEPQLKEKKLNPGTAAYDQKLTKLAPAVGGLRIQLEGLREQITKKNTQLKKLENKLFPKLKDYYRRMEQDSLGLLNLSKQLGEKMGQKAKSEQDTVMMYQKKLDDQKKAKANELLLKAAAEAERNYTTTMAEIQTEIAKLSGSEQRLWGILTDLYHRVLLTESIIMYGSSGIKKWTLPQILRIKLPKKKKGK